MVIDTQDVPSMGWTDERKGKPTADDGVVRESKPLQRVRRGRLRPSAIAQHFWNAQIMPPTNPPLSLQPARRAVQRLVFEMPATAAGHSGLARPCAPSW